MPLVDIKADAYLLKKGAHKMAEDGRCAMEWVAYLAGEPHSDKPKCVSPVLREFGVRVNDVLPDDQRQRLRPYLARMIGTTYDGLDAGRGWLCVDWLVREYAPAFLDLVSGLRGYASDLRALPEVSDGASLAAAQPVLARSREAAVAAAAAAAAGGVAWVAAGAAAGVAAGGVAWVAAGAAAGVATGGVAGAVAVAVAMDAARAAAGDAARGAARGAVAPAVSACRDSILRPGGLLDRMLPTEVIQLPVTGDVSSGVDVDACAITTLTVV